MVAVVTTHAIQANEQLVEKLTFYSKQIAPISDNAGRDDQIVRYPLQGILHVEGTMGTFQQLKGDPQKKVTMRG